jgi:hypothetical protein
MNPSSTCGKQRVRGLENWGETFLSGSILTVTEVAAIGSESANGSLQTHITTRGSRLPRSPLAGHGWPAETGGWIGGYSRHLEAPSNRSAILFFRPRNSKWGQTRVKMGPVVASAIEQRSVKSLIAYAKNALTHPPAQVTQIVASIVEFGFTNPILIDSEGESSRATAASWRQRRWAWRRCHASSSGT